MFISIDDAKLFATSFGNPKAKAIVGIGGWTGNWELWLDVFAHLSPHYHLIAYDHRGAGATLAPLTSITLDRLVEDVFAVMDHYGVQRAVLAAESAGARTALAAALKHPERISALVLVDGLVHNDTPEDKDQFMANLHTNYNAALQWFVNACLPDPAHQSLRHWGLQILTRASQAAAIQLLRVNKTPDLRGQIKQIFQPALLIHCTGDALVPLKSVEWLAQELPQAHMRLIESGEHVPTITQPNVVAQWMADFITEQTG